MWNKTVLTIVFIIFVLWGFYYFLVDSSYSKSLEAKFLYYEGRYEEALELGQIAYKEDHYNRMAFMVITQSKEAIRWRKFINESSEFLLRAKEIANKDYISTADRLEIKVMSEIVIDQYLKLNRLSPFIDEDMKKRAKYLNDEFVKLYDELN